jgi:hypothetical protein
MDAGPDTFAAESVVEVKALDGTVVALVPFTGSPAQRLIVEPAPALGMPEAATPTA